MKEAWTLKVTLAIILRPRLHDGDLSGQVVKMNKKFIRIHLLRLDVMRRSSNRKDLIWIKTNTDKKVVKVLP